MESTWSFPVWKFCYQSFAQKTGLKGKRLTRLDKPTHVNLPCFESQHDSTEVSLVYLDWQQLSWTSS